MSSAPPDKDNSITFSMSPITNGYPVIVDDKFTTAIAATKAGGDATWAYFNAMNQTSDFWGGIASKTLTFAPGTDPQGNLVSIASSGNIDMRLQAVYTAAQQQGVGDGVIVGTATVAAANTTTGVSQMLALAVRLASMPAYLPMSAALFKQLLVPIYSNAQKLLTKLARSLQQEAQVENPEIDALEDADEMLEEQSDVVDALEGEVVEEGLEYMSIDWAAAGLNFAGLSALAALPMLVEYLGHEMYHSVIIQNLTDLEFTWSNAYQAHGSVAFQPGSTTIPAQSRFDAVGGPVTLSYQANFQVINSTDFGSIGYVLALTPGDGSSTANIVVSIPWGAENSIWVGPSSSTPKSLYDSYSQPNGCLSQSATFGTYQITVSINKLSGKTNDTYFYCSTVVIEPINS